jgi:hypothetical protein
VCFIKYFGGYEVEKHGRARHVVRNRGKENAYMVCWGNWKGNGDLEKLGIGEKIILKWALN